MELILIPIISALIVYFAPKQWNNLLALIASIITFGFSVYMLNNFTADGSFRYAYDIPWFSKSVHFAVGIDGISMLLVLLTNVLVPVIILGSFKKQIENNALFFALILVMQAALNGVFVARDAIMFYVFWELALIPIYFIAALWNENKNFKTTLRFFLYTFIGSLAMLASFIYLGSKVDSSISHTFHYTSLVKITLTNTESLWVGLGILLAFAVKIPLLPFHSWQADTYTESPLAGTQLLSGIMLKMGLYGLIRWFLPLVPENYSLWTQLITILGVIGVLYGALIAMRSSDMKRLSAFSSLSHVGLIAASIACINYSGLQGAILQIFAHGVSVVGIFLCIDIIQTRALTRDLPSLGGIAKQAPYFAALFFIIVLGTMAVPFTIGFPGELLMLNAVFKTNVILGVLAGLTVILCAVYMLRMYNLSMFGKPAGNIYLFPDLRMHEWAALSILVLLVLVIGVYPQCIVDLTKSSIEKVIMIITENKGGIA